MRSVWLVWLFKDHNTTSQHHVPSGWMCEGGLKRDKFWLYPFIHDLMYLCHHWENRKEKGLHERVEEAAMSLTELSDWISSWFDE